MKVTNVRGTMNALEEKGTAMFTREEAPDSYIRHLASKLKRDTGKVFKVNYHKGVGTKVTRIA